MQQQSDERRPRSTLEGRMTMVTADFYAILELLSAAIMRRTFLEERHLTACVEYRDICRAEKALREALVIPAPEWTEAELREAYGR